MPNNLIHASEKKTAEMMYIASHPTNPWLAPEAYDYPKSSVEEYATTHTTVKAFSSGNYSTESAPANDTEVAYDAQDAFIKHLASQVKVD